jgi:hypothetical protein
MVENGMGRQCAYERCTPREKGGLDERWDGAGQTTETSVIRDRMRWNGWTDGRMGMDVHMRGDGTRDGYT